MSPLKSSVRNRLLFLIPLFAGLFLAFYPVWLSAFSRMQTDYGDTRLNNFILEHVYHWMTFQLKEGSFWNPTFFFPAENTLAYTDLFLSFTPFYALFRLLGFPEDQSLTLWMMSMFSLNYGVYYWLLRRELTLSPLASAAGSFLFAFASSRLIQNGHQQLIPQFYPVLSLIGLIRLFRVRPSVLGRNPEGLGESPWLWIGLFCLSTVLQFWGAFYWAYFWALSLGVAFAWALLLPRLRKPLLEVLIRFRFAVLFWLIFGLTCLVPVAEHYLKTASQVGYRDFSHVGLMTPPLQAWLFMGEESWLYSWTSHIRAMQIISMKHEQRIGIGLLTTFATLLGLIWNRKKLPLASILLLSGLTLFVMVTDFRHGIHPWKFFFEVLPGAGAVRAVARIGIFMLLGGGVGFALFFDRLRTFLKEGLQERVQDPEKRARQILVLFFGFCILEQATRLPSFEIRPIRQDVAQLETEVAQAFQQNSSCKAFFYSPTRVPSVNPTPGYKYQLDAMWVSVKMGIPTVNGYSGNTPPGWKLDSNVIEGPNFEESEKKFLERLDTWAAQNSGKLQRSEICWIKSKEK